jgi:hypothetical protein
LKLANLAKVAMAAKGGEGDELLNRYNHPWWSIRAVVCGSGAKGLKSLKNLNVQGVGKSRFFTFTGAAVKPHSLPERPSPPASSPCAQGERDCLANRGLSFTIRADGSQLGHQVIHMGLFGSPASTRSSAAPDAAASRNRAAHMVGMSKVARVHAAKPPAVMISTA